MHHKSRLATKPGITGMWQVSGRSDITDFEEVVRLDTEYIEKEIIAEVNAISDYTSIKTMSENKALGSGLLSYIGSDVDDAYAATLHKLTMAPAEIEAAKDIKIVYSPLHGTGLELSSNYICKR